MSDGSGAMGDDEKLAEIERRLAVVAKSGWRVSGFRKDAGWLVAEVRRVRLERDAELAEERNAEIERLRAECVLSDHDWLVLGELEANDE